MIHRLFSSILPKLAAGVALAVVVNRPRPQALVRLLLGVVLVGVGVGLAFLLYRWMVSDGSLFSWSVASPYSPLVAVLIGGGSAALLGLWVVNQWGQFDGSGYGRVLVSISLIWVGFGAGLFGPAALGREGSWEGGVRSTDSEVVSSSMYSLDLEYVELSEELGNFWFGSSPGPYVSNGSDRRHWIAINSTGTRGISPVAETQKTGEVAIASFSLNPKMAFQDLINLTDLDPRIQQIRDIQSREGGLIFSNVELKSDCLVLQVWSADLSQSRNRVDSVELIWESHPCLDVTMAIDYIDGAQSGGRVAVTDDGSILLAVGDFRLGLSLDQEYKGRPDYLGAAGSYGKILRIMPGGDIQTISSGHRNPQGLFVDSRNNSIWSSEHGPAGGGELNLIKEGRDYGWPDVTIGFPYAPKLPEANWEIGRWGSAHEGYEKPVLSWLPSIAPSQLLVYMGSEFPGWRNDVILATLRDQSLRRIRLDNGRVVFDERIEVGERIRDLVELEDGRLLLSFDSGRLGLLSLAKTR